MSANARSRIKKNFAVAYTPGVAEPCLEIQSDEHLALATYTGKGNTVAVITDGTAVLGLGDIGPSAGMPVMEEMRAVRLCGHRRRTDPHQQ